jgi:CubicO group peptidase (beta-lactamase class C family)
MNASRFAPIPLAGLLALAAGLAPIQATAAEPLYFPPTKGEWQRVTPAAAGWNAAKLEAALKYAGDKRASGVVILHRGRIMAEQYWSPDESAQAGGKPREYGAMVVGRDDAGRVIEDVASVQKSVAAMLVGIAQHQGLLKLDDPVAKHLGAGWTKAAPEQERAITVRHLVTMTSGLTDDLTFEAPAGSRWRYNSAAYARTIKVVAAAAGKSPNELTGAWLTARIGMGHSRWVERPGTGRNAVPNALGSPPPRATSRASACSSSPKAGGTARRSSPTATICGPP